MLRELFNWLGKSSEKASAQENLWPIREEDKTPPLIYAIGDVHGCSVLLSILEEKILADATQHDHKPVLIMLGDYVDRGENTRQVISQLITPFPAGASRICMAGNHEEMFLKFLDDPSRNASWLDFGGWETLLSYGFNPKLLAKNKLKDRRLRYEIDALIPEEHMQFLKSLCLIQRFGTLVFVHAGIDRSVSIGAQLQKDALWMNNKPDDDRAPYLLIHGHSPYEQVFVSPYRLGVDTGAFQSGKLSAVKILDGVFAGIITT